MHDDLNQLVDDLFRRESARITAALVRVVGTAHVDLVDDVVQDALAGALAHWRFHGVPDNPAAWLTRVARNKAVDALRRDAFLRKNERAVIEWAERAQQAQHEEETLDEQLRLMFACCHPRLPRDARLALTLRTIGGFGVGEFARAFLISHDAAAQRLVRAKRVIREENIPLEMPEADELDPRLDHVLETLYLMFNEGYAAHGGDRLIRREFVEEACRLTSMLLKHERTAQPTVHALLALMLFLAARMDTRTDDGGGVVLLDEQDRSRWDGALIQRGFHHLQQSAGGNRVTSYHLEAAIAACHARARTFDETDWDEIASLYDLLLEINAGPVVALNRAVAIGMAFGPERGLAELDALANEQRLERYYLFAAARGEILARAGRHGEAAKAFRAALELGCTEPERALLRRKLARAEAVV